MRTVFYNHLILVAFKNRSGKDDLCRVNSGSSKDKQDRSRSDSIIDNPDRSYTVSSTDNRSLSGSSTDKPDRSRSDGGRKGSSLFLPAGYSVIFFLLFSAFSLQAQTFNAGVSAGISISQVDGDALSGYNKAGAAFGLFVNRALMEKLAAQLEINYISKGSQLKTTLEDPRYYRMELHYIEIPLLMKYAFSTRFLAEGGISGGYLFQSDEKDSLGEIPGTVAFRKAELAALAGISYLVSENLSINTRLSYSVIPIRKHAGGGTWFFNRGQNNNVLSFSLRYQF